MKIDKIPIIFTFDSNWVLPAVVCFYSFFKYKKQETEYEFIVIHKELPEESQCYLQKYVDKWKGITLRFIEIDKNLVDGYQLSERGSAPFSMDCYTRLFIPDILTEYDKVIYSDVDVIILDDMSDAFQCKLEENYLGVVKDLRMNDKILLNKHPRFESKHYGHYFYAGFLVMNLKIMREKQLVATLAKEAAQGYKLQDQDVFNIVCFKNVLFLHQKYTVLTSNLNSDIPLLDALDMKDEYKEALGNPVIYHYAGREKPWDYCLFSKPYRMWWRLCKEANCYTTTNYLNAFIRGRVVQINLFFRSLKRYVRSLLND